MEFRIVKINHEFKNVVVSHKALIEADIEEQKKEIISQLEKGQVLEGIVKNITTYGVFVDLGGVDGLIHITDLSWNRINHPTEILELDQKLNVVILDFDDDKSRIQLGVKQLSKHPWENLDSNLKEGDKIKGKVSVLADYGAFIEIADGVEGLVHVSEMSWSTHLRSAQDFVKIGDEVEVIILTLDREERKMSLGIKQLTSDPWTDITNKYPIKSKHNGKIRNFTNFGVFVELEEGIDGLIYISDLSWTKKIKHPSELFTIGDKVDVIVLELDVNERKLSLGHKQTKINPWDDYLKKYPIDSINKFSVESISERGGSIFLNEELSAFVPKKHLFKEDGTSLKTGEEAEFKVIEFNSDFKRIVMSHSATYKNEVSTPKKVKVSVPKQKVDKSTLGDIEALAELKKKMDQEEDK
jgi:small subunit ribosomal protein S1